MTQFLGLLATFSRSALLALLLVVFITGLETKFFQKQKTHALAGLGMGILLVLFFIMRGFTFLEDPAFLERLSGYTYAWELMKTHPFGIGFSHSTLFLDPVTSLPLMPWEYQPVHNIFLLLLTELGWPSLLLLFAVRFKKNTYWGAAILILIIGLFDHYLLTLDQGRFFAVFVLTLLAIKKGASPDKTPADPQ